MVNTTFWYKVLNTLFNTKKYAKNIVEIKKIKLEVIETKKLAEM